MSKVLRKSLNVADKRASFLGGSEMFHSHAAELRLEEKIHQRRFQWRWNVPLVVKTIVLGTLLVSVAAISHYYFSQQTASTFLQRARAAEEEKDFAEQVKWLGRYSMLVPNDHEAIVSLAIAADEGADRSKPAARYDAIDLARKQLGNAIARLGTEKADETTTQELRRRLIKRLLQQGGLWNREAERQVKLLDAPEGDPESVRWMALALYSQVEQSLYQERESAKYDRTQDYWYWLADQKVGEVLSIALQHNKTDLDLIASFVSAVQSKPELFEQSGPLIAAPGPQRSSASETSAAESLTSSLDKRLDFVTEPIRNNEDSRSQLILSQVERRGGDDTVVSQRLRRAAEFALLRLAESVSRTDKPASDGGQPALEQPVAKSSIESAKNDSDLSEVYWDYVLVAEAALQLAQVDAVQAVQWYEKLLAHRPTDVPPVVIENVFVNAGLLSLRQGKRERAIEIWELGLKELNPNSLDLLGSLATLLSQDGQNSERTKSVLDDFREAISASSSGLARMEIGRITQAEKNARGRKIETAKWRLGVLDGQMAIRDGDSMLAIAHFRSALDDSSDGEVTEKVAVATQLASLYGQQGLWDQVADTLQKAVDLDPGNAVLRGQAAEAWTRSGNRVQAVEQWRFAGLSDSPVLQIASVEAMFNYQLRLMPEQRDFSGVRSQIKRIRTRLSKLTEPSIRDEIGRAVRRLDVLEISLPTSGVDAEEHLNSATMADGVARLSVEYVDDENIQAFAAERLAAVGRDDESDQAIARLEAIVGSAATQLAIVRARIEASRGDPEAAVKRVMAQAELLLGTERNDLSTIESRRNEDVIDSLLALAAEFSARANDPEMAYRALTKIPEGRRPLSVLFSLATLAKSLPVDSTLLKDGDLERTPSQLSVIWEEQLRAKEGDQGTYWRFLKVARIIDNLLLDSNEIERTDPRLKEARSVLRELLSWRPRWGEAISLEGWLLAIEGRSEEAIEQLRRGIAAGDRRLQTRQGLVEQLIRLHREAEAEEEIRLMSFATDAEVDKYATTRIQLAQRQGDYERGIAVAKTAVQERPNDFLSHVVLCLALTVAAIEDPDEQSRGSLFDQAESAIRRAESLATKSEPAIISARLRLHVAQENKEELLSELKQLDEGSLDEMTRLTMKAQVYIAMEDFEAALPLLRKADQLRPSTQTQLALVELYRKLRRENEAIEALRTAQSRNPENDELRNELALSLAVRDGASVDWTELSKLLTANNQVTSKNRFLYAALLGTQGNDQQKSQALVILRELVQEQNSRSDDAARFLASLLIKLAETLPEEQYSLRERWMVEARKTYETLTLRGEPQVVDLYRYATLLIDDGQKEDLPKVETLLSQLQSMKEGVFAALEIAVRYAEKSGQSDTAPQLVESWADRVSKDEILNDSSIAAFAGGTLLKLGFKEQGLSWLDRAYREDLEMIVPYVAALNRAGEFKRSAELSAKHFEEHQDVQSATLLVSSLLQDMHFATTANYENLLNSAIMKFGDNVSLLESVATLRLQQRRIEDAITLYQKVLDFDPIRVRTLNNLAMAFSEMPGRASEGLDPINTALKLTGDNPELLDTKGVVLLGARRWDEARDTFQQAILKSDEPRFRFHLILALLALDKQGEAKQAWESLDLARLDPAGLTANEQARLESLKSEFGS